MALPLPGQRPARLPTAETEVSRAMDQEVADAVRSPYFDIMMHSNTSASARDHPEPLLLVKRDPHQVRPWEDTGIVCTRTEEGLRIELEDPPNADKYDFEDLQLDSPHKLCLSCRDAFNYYCKYKRDTPSTVEADSWPNSVILHHNLVSLSASANVDNCQLCLPIGFYLTAKYPGIFREDHRKFRLEMCWQSSKLLDDDRIYFAMVNNGREKDIWNFNHIYRMDVWSADQHAQNFDLPVLEDGQYSLRTDSKTARDLSVHWLERCLKSHGGHHSRCNDKVEPYLPTRLLDVSESTRTGKLRLFPTVEAAKESYISLSHCWGQGRNPILTTTNYAKRCEVGLDLATLPKTFQDAVIVCQWFHVKWLWIDCLCILQDSKDDWLREATLMDQTYKQALLNISADASYDSSGGLFGDRKPTDYLPLAITAPKLGRSWKLTPCPTFQFAWTRDAPTFSRAWVHRERQLSRRILHFTSDQIIWECCGSSGHGFASDTIPGDPLLQHTFDTDNKQHLHGLQQSGSGDASRSWSELQDSWDDVCRNMSRKNLTVLTDMPIVVSSLAEDFLALLPTGDEYLCGIWKSSLPQSLLWESTRNKPTDNLPYIAPSWSWMSTPCGTRFTARKHAFYSIVHDIARTESVDLQHKYPDSPYGPLTKGTITLTGFLRQVRFTFAGTSDDDPDFTITLHVFDGDRKRYIGPHWDSHEGDLFQLHVDHVQDTRALDCWCLFVATKLSDGREAPKQEIMALLVVKHGREWKRIGTVRFMDDYALKMRYVMTKRHVFGKDRVWEKKRAGLKRRQTGFWQEWKAGRERNEGNGVEETGPSVDRADVSQLYAFDDGLDVTGLERLNTQTISLV